MLSFLRRLLPSCPRPARRRRRLSQCYTPYLFAGWCADAVVAFFVSSRRRLHGGHDGVGIDAPFHGHPSTVLDRVYAPRNALGDQVEAENRVEVERRGRRQTETTQVDEASSDASSLSSHGAYPRPRTRAALRTALGCTRIHALQLPGGSSVPNVRCEQQFAVCFRCCPS